VLVKYLPAEVSQNDGSLSTENVDIEETVD